MESANCRINPNKVCQPGEFADNKTACCVRRCLEVKSIFRKGGGFSPQEEIKIAMKKVGFAGYEVERALDYLHRSKHVEFKKGGNGARTWGLVNRAINE